MKVMAMLPGEGVQPALCHYCYAEWQSKRAPGHAEFVEWMPTAPYQSCVLLDGEWVCAHCLEKLVQELNGLEDGHPAGLQ